MAIVLHLFQVVLGHSLVLLFGCSYTLDQWVEGLLVVADSLLHSLGLGLLLHEFLVIGHELFVLLVFSDLLTLFFFHFGWALFVLPFNFINLVKLLLLFPKFLLFGCVLCFQILGLSTGLLLLAFLGSWLGRLRAPAFGLASLFLLTHFEVHLKGLELSELFLVEFAIGLHFHELVVEGLRLFVSELLIASTDPAFLASLLAGATRRTGPGPLPLPLHWLVLHLLLHELHLFDLLGINFLIFGFGFGLGTELGVGHNIHDWLFLSVTLILVLGILAVFRGTDLLNFIGVAFGEVGDLLGFLLALRKFVGESDFTFHNAFVLFRRLGLFLLSLLKG